MKPLLKQIEDFSAEAHKKQKRRYTPDPYIVHPIRVMEICSKYTNDDAVLAAALLHDVLEDTSTTKKEILEFLSQIMPPHQALKATTIVEELTDVYTKQKFPQWNRKKRKKNEAERLGRASAEAQTVKYADIIDNAPEIAACEPDFAEKYLAECKLLLKSMKKGNKSLHEMALQVVDRSFKWQQSQNELDQKS